MVARGLIAKTIRHLEDTVDRIDIVYVCSNAAIANQNLNRLNVYGNRHFAMATRLTLLPAHLKGLKANRVNFVSSTPGTTFDLKGRSGVMEERRVLYQMLRDRFDLSRTGLLNLLQATAGKDRWGVYAERPVEIDSELERLFLRDLRDDGSTLASLRETAEIFHRFRDFTPDESNRRYAVVSALRRSLARVCVSALEPDLVLDEFQRFKELLDGEDEGAQLAKALFRQPQARVLLLSATPYKMLTLNHETDEDHYQDFRRTLEFLFGSREAVSEIVDNLERFRRALHGMGRESEGETRLLLATDWKSVVVPPRVFVCENPSVVASASHQLRVDSAPLICLDGEPKTAGWLLLDRLRGAGSEILYHGDFDWKGLAIARRVFTRVGAHPWRYSVRDYLDAEGVEPLQGSPEPTPWCPELASTLIERQIVIHEEAVILRLLEDLRK